MAAHMITRKAASVVLAAGTAPIARACLAAPHPVPAVYQQSASFCSVAQLRGPRFARASRTAPGVRTLATASLVQEVEKKNQEHPVIVYSKSWCPYCAQVKELFKKMDVDAKIVELDSVVEGDDVQAALFEISASRTVPQVFIGGEFVGGADDTLMEEHSGKLQKRLEKAGITPKA